MPPLPDLILENRINRFMVLGILGLMALLGIALFFAVTYEPQQQRTWRIAITNWPGHDYIYLAERKGFFTEQGLNIKLVPINSVTDIRTAYERELVDGYATSIADIADSIHESGTPGSIIVATDYSSGGDKLLVDPSITTLTDLKGKRVGIELTSALGRYLLERMLKGTGVNSTDLLIKPFNQTVLADQVSRNLVDAVITSEPNAARIRASRPMNELFNSNNIPQELVNVVFVSSRMRDLEPDLSHRFQQAWQSAIDYANAYPEEATALLAQRNDIGMNEYKDIASGITLITTRENQHLASTHAIEKSLMDVSTVLDPQSPLLPQQVSSAVNIWFKEARR